MQGKVELFSCPDEVKFMELPENTIFGEYQVFFNLKSNILYKTRPQVKWSSNSDEPIEDYEDDFRTMFMCVKSEVFLNLCDLYPKTSEAMRKLALERRELTLFFLNQVNNSISPQKSDMNSLMMSGIESHICIETSSIINQERSISESINQSPEKLETT